MNTATHEVVPERIMALLDGELSSADAQAVMAHLDTCAQCAQLAERLRSTSQLLSAWRVPDIPSRVEERITALVKNTGPGFNTRRASLLLRPQEWTWGRWAIWGGGALAALLVALALSVPTWRFFQPAESVQTDGSLKKREGGYGGGGSAGKGSLRAPEQQSRASGRQPTPLNPLVTLSQPGLAADSNGLFHGLGDHDQSRFAVDGQPVTDQQSRVASSTLPTLMIARTVSLSIVVKDFAASRTALDALLARHHGYAAQLVVSTPENAARSLQASLRVPAPELSSAVGDFKRLGRVETESQAGEEVTRQHADLVIRLKNARETEQRFRAILQQRAGNVAEVLQVEEEIARVGGEIERMEAEQTALEHRVDFAGIELQLTEEYKAQLNPPAASVTTRIHNAFVAGYHNATDSVLGLILWLEEYGPASLIWFLIFTLPAIFLWRRYQKKAAAV